jgi:mono/diheme cytochrome c family protein
MKFLKLGLVFTMLALFFIACTQSQISNSNTAPNTAVVTSTNSTPEQPARPVDELAEAKKIYTEQCINCHKADGTGGPGVIEGKKIKAPNFTSDKLKKEPDAEFIEVIENGEKADGMPAYKGQLSDQEIKNLVKYIRKEFQGK